MAALLIAGGIAGCAQQFGGGGSGIVAPPPDFGACSDARKRFYQASQSAVADEQNRQSLERTSALVSSAPMQGLLGRLGGSLPGGGNLASNMASSLRDMSSRANADTGLIRQFAVSFDELARCRRDEVAALRRDLRARRTTRTEATGQAGEIKERALADAEVARRVNAQLSARTRQYQADISTVDTQLGAEPVYSPRRAEVARVRQTVQTNEKALVTQAAAVDSSVRERAFDVISSLPQMGNVLPA